jgi:DNA-binding Lrp family transcriptional regulator
MVLHEERRNVTTPASIDDLDRQIVDALQTYPRAPWSLLGQVLGIDPVTVGRRWDRMKTSGTAWVTAYLGGAPLPPNCGAVMEIDCENNASAIVARAIAEDPRAVTVLQTAGGRDLIVLIQARDLPSLSRYVADELPSLAGVRSARTSMVTGSITEGSHWRSEVLDPSQRSRLERVVPVMSGKKTGGGPLQPVDYRIASVLSTDGRMPHHEIAAAAGTSESTVRRRLPQLFASRAIILRCDLARSQSTRPVGVTFFADIPARELPRIDPVMARLPGMRACVTVAGPRSLVIDVWLHRIDEIHEVERLLDETSPHFQVRDRTVTLRMIKHMGRILNEDGTNRHAIANDLTPLPERLG